MTDHQDAVIPRPRFDRLHRLLVAGVITSISCLLVYALAGATGLVMAFFAVVIRLTLTPDLIQRLHPRFKQARLLSRVVALDTHLALDQLASRANLTAIPSLLVTDRPGLDAQTISTPFGAAIIVNRDMLKTFSHDELEGVLAHEVAHIKNCDGYIAWGLSVAAMLAFIFMVAGAILGWSRLEGLSAAIATEGMSVIDAMVMICILAMLLNVVVLRALESDADLVAVSLTGNPVALAAALGKHSASGTPPQASIFDAHPPIGKRVARLEAMTAGTINDA